MRASDDLDLQSNERASLLSSLEVEHRALIDARRDAALHRAIVEAAPDALLVVDAEGRIRQVNAQTHVIFGYLASELIGQPVEKLIPARYRTKHVQDRATYSREPHTRPMSVGLDLYGLSKDGVEIPVEISLSPVETPDGPFTLAAIRDTTERRAVEERLRTEETLRRSHERFRLLLENVTDLIVVLDRDRRIQYASPAFRASLGREPTDLIGHRLREIAHPEDGERLRDFLVDRLATPGVTPSIEFRLAHVDGSWRTFEGVGNNLLGNPGLAGIVFTLRDTTERRKLEAQLVQTQKMESIGRLAGGVAHDFNNLLTSILGYTDLAIDALPADASALECLQVVRRAGEQAAALTRQLLLFSRRQVTQLRPVDVNEMVADVERLLRRVIGETIELRLQTAPGIGQVRVDPDQVEQVLLNLAVNARDAMPEGGTLVLASEVLALDEAFARTHPGTTPGEYACMTVTDTGVGMTDEVKAHLFEPFFTTKERGKGTGLGLATSYAIVKQCGGTISVYSEAGHGTTIRVCLPRVAAASVEGSAEASLSPAPRGDETVLVVEDEPSLRDLVEHVLGTFGYRVLATGSGEEALAVAGGLQGPLHLVLTDVIMPGMSGTALAERLRAMRPEVRVLFMSGYAAHPAIAPGAPLVSKPFTPRSLGRKVREVLDGPTSA